MTGEDALSSAAAVLAQQLREVGWRVDRDPASFWTTYLPSRAISRDAGTKLHVSASSACAVEVLYRCAEILGTHRVGFKHAADLAKLSFLSSGRGGETQIGKFLTVYPRDEEAAQRLAALLHDATAHLSGPRIRDEEPYCEGSLVHLRFGSFRREWIQLPTGQFVTAIRRGETLEPDERARAESSIPVPSTLRGRYVRVQLIARGPKGNVCLGFVDDDTGGSLVMVKEAYAHAMENARGQDARSRLRDEFTCLTAIKAEGIAPRPLEYWEESGSAFLVYEPVLGSPLSSVLATLHATGMRPTLDLVARWTEQLCELTARLHRAGFVSCDIKPANIVLTEDGLALIDLELAGPVSEEPAGGMGTPGYCSPQQADPARGRSVTDDVFGIGATMLAMVTSVEASVLPTAERVLEVETRRDPHHPLLPVIARCTEPEATRRPSAADKILPRLPLSGRSASTPEGAPDTALWRQLIESIGDRLASSSITSSDRRFTWWRSDHSTISGQAGRDLYAGSAGTALFLVQAARELDRPDFLEAAQRCGNWLWQTEPEVPRQEPMPGLYFGDCGAGLLYLGLFESTRDECWRDRAAVVSDRVGTQARSPDLMTGLAGVGLFNLQLLRSGGADVALSRALECVQLLIERKPRDSFLWRLPSAFGRLSGQEYLGLSHGTAGVGYLLAAAAVQTNETQLIAYTRAVAHWLMGRGNPATADGSGLTWGSADGKRALGINWCHGAPGILRFLIATHAATGDEAILEAALAAGRTTAASHWIGTSQCHGLAGNLDALMDLAHYTKDDLWRVKAWALAEELREYHAEGGWPSDERILGCPDLMVGEAGVGAALLRLVATSLPHLVCGS